MSYWDEVKGVVAKGAQLAADGIKTGAKAVYDTAKEGVSTMKAEAELIGKQWDYQRALADLGDKVYALYKDQTNPYTNEEFLTLLKKCQDIEAKCKELDAKVHKK